MAPPLTGLLGAEDALSRGLAAGLSGLEAGIGGGVGALQGFADPGRSAVALQAAQSGALGPEQQAQAFANFQSSPGQQFLRDEAERALLRNTSAIGGLGGGNVRRALQEQAVGLAAQDFGNQFERLGQIGALGAGAAGQQAGLLGRGGELAGQFGIGTGQNLAQARTRAGEQIAGNVAGTTSALANLINAQGGQLAGVIGQGGSNLANLLSGAGAAQAASTQDLAALLANLAVGQGTTVAGLPGIPGTTQRPGILGDVGNLAAGSGAFLEGLALGSDARTKTDIRRVGTLPSGLGWYRWRWNTIGERLFGHQPGEGVIAQEVAGLMPWAVLRGADGFLRVDYARIG